MSDFSYSYCSGENTKPHQEKLNSQGQIRAGTQTSCLISRLNKPCLPILSAMLTSAALLFTQFPCIRLKENQVWTPANRSLLHTEKSFQVLSQSVSYEPNTQQSLGKAGPYIFEHMLLPFLFLLLHLGWGILNGVFPQLSLLTIQLNPAQPQNAMNKT